MYVAVGDFNRDNKLDLAVVNVTDNTVGVLTGDGTGKFAAQVTYPVGGGANAGPDSILVVFAYVLAVIGLVYVTQ